MPNAPNAAYAVAQVVRRQIDGELYTRPIVGLRASPKDGAPVARIGCPGRDGPHKCLGEYAATDFTGHKAKPFCPPCFRSYRTRYGVEIKSVVVWKYRDRLLAPRISTQKEKKHVRVFWRMPCLTDGCDNAVVVEAGRPLRCVCCGVAARRLPPYVMLHRSHLSLTAQRVERGRHHPGTRLQKLEDFVAAIDRCGPLCHYCGIDVQRNIEGATYVRHDGTKEYSTACFLDRLDSLRPYVAGNLVTACEGCNALKAATLSEMETLLIVALRMQNHSLARTYVEALSKPYPFPTPRGWNGNKIRLRPRNKKPIYTEQNVWSTPK